MSRTVDRITALPRSVFRRSGWADRPRRVESGPGAGLLISRTGASADYRHGTNELPVQVAVVDGLAPGGVFLDIGANVGFFSLLAARVVGARGAVHAIEPVPSNVRQIKVNAAANKFDNISVVEAAASSASGTTTLLLAEHPGGAVVASAGAPPDPAGSVEVRTVTVDDLVKSGALRPPTLVKIDVEGAEVEALEGMVDTLHEHRPVVVCEVDGSDDSSLATRRSQVVALLQQCGYEVTPLERSYEASEWHVDHLVARPVGDPR